MAAFATPPGGSLSSSTPGPSGSRRSGSSPAPAAGAARGGLMSLDALVIGEPLRAGDGRGARVRRALLAGGHYATETFGIRRLGRRWSRSASASPTSSWTIPNPIWGILGPAGSQPPGDLRSAICGQSVDTSAPADIPLPGACRRRRGTDARSPDADRARGQVADEAPREVLSKCIEMNVPVLGGRIDRTLFESSLRAIQAPDKRATA